MRLVILAALLAGLAVSGSSSVGAPPNAEPTIHLSNAHTRLGIFNAFEAVHDPILLIVRLQH
ncbi:hypothetical protein ACPPVQ_05820 [Diaminobutyricibacter sp. McL0618]|uniref:hypothetical protein n=1 Tax=Leifsonia sp. McL0618 TaxID=3415677 RepID=UPI003CEC310E